MALIHSVAEHHERESKPARRAGYPPAETVARNLNDLPLHAAVLDGTGTIVSVNEAWRRFGPVTHYRGEGDGVGVDYIALCETPSRAFSKDADDSAAAAGALRRIIAGELANFSLEYPCHGPSVERWFLFLASPLPRRGPSGAAVVHLDITTLKQALAPRLSRTLEALAQAEQRLKDFAELASGWFWEMDADCRFVSIDGQPARDSGLAPESWIGRTLPEIAAPGGDPAVWRRYRCDLEARRPFRDFVVRCLDAAGRTRYLRLSGKPIHAAAGSFGGYRGVGADFTAQVEAADRRAAKVTVPRAPA